MLIKNKLPSLLSTMNSYMARNCWQSILGPAIRVQTLVLESVHMALAHMFASHWNY
jgi:hypothetical protein